MNGVNTHHCGVSSVTLLICGINSESGGIEVQSCEVEISLVVGFETGTHRVICGTKVFQGCQVSRVVGVTKLVAECADILRESCVVVC
jgi:hypothetical protein